MQNQTTKYSYAADAATLKSLVEKYPYFSHANFLLLKQTDVQDKNYAAIAAKTALHFDNPYLLDLQLNAAEFAEHHAQPVATIEEAPIAKAEPIITEASAVTELSTDEDFLATDDVKIEASEVETKAQTALPGEELPKIPSLKMEAVKEDAPLFEPLYSTDYFASQGIRLSDNVPATDRVSLQLRSFTDWLKTMKKLHPTEMEKSTGGTAIDATVQNLAEKSNREEEIITEAMAEVFIQQGKPAKAREIYEKLSLLNPAKNAYFAAKLNELS